MKVKTVVIRYYHRGQVYFITGEFSKAMSEYRQSTTLDPTFIFSQIQLAVAQYKSGETEKAMHMFRKLIRENQASAEVYNYYGELLLDQGKFGEAVENFDRSIELAKNKYVVFLFLLPFLSLARSLSLTLSVSSRSKLTT